MQFQAIIAGEVIIEHSNQPVASTERIVNLDVIRGFAVLGILMMNIISYGLISEKYSNPYAQGELSTSSYVCWWVGHVFFDIKFWTIFSTLFGAGIALMWERAQSRGQKSTGIHYRRMFWLLLIGLAHAHFIWFGDILVMYALTGSMLFWFVSWRPKWLLVMGFGLLSAGAGIMLAIGLSLPHLDPETLAEMKSNWVPTMEMVNEELEIYRGSWWEQMRHRSPTAFFFETFLFGALFFWRSGGLFLIGMALYKLGVLSGKRSTRFYALGTMIGLGIGFAWVLLGVYLNEANQWSYEFSFMLGTLPNYVGGLGVSFGYICGLQWLIRLGWFQRAFQVLAAVGQMALTNYLMQSILCTTLFYGHGLGWFGHLNRIQLVGIVFAIWALQLTWSPLWLTYFRFGPFEWLWRSLSYWRLQPLRQDVVT